MTIDPCRMVRRHAADLALSALLVVLIVVCAAASVAWECRCFLN